MEGSGLGIWCFGEQNLDISSYFPYLNTSYVPARECQQISVTHRKLLTTVVNEHIHFFWHFSAQLFMVWIFVISRICQDFLQNTHATYSCWYFAGIQQTIRNWYNICLKWRWCIFALACGMVEEWKFYELVNIHHIIFLVRIFVVKQFQKVVSG